MIRRLQIAALAFYVLATTSLGQTDLAREAEATLAASCYGCHNAQLQMGGLRLDSRPAALAKAIVAGNSSGSLLVKRITGSGGLARMPMGGAPLSKEKIELIQKWIDAGAAWPGASAASKHWAFVPPVRPALPRPGHPIDAFIQARLDREGLKPSPAADRATL